VGRKREAAFEGQEIFSLGCAGVRHLRSVIATQISAAAKGRKRRKGRRKLIGCSRRSVSLLPIASQIEALYEVNELKAIWAHLAGGRQYGAMTAYRLAERFPRVAGIMKKCLDDNPNELPTLAALVEYS
jgi:hypothetical protein